MGDALIRAQYAVVSPDGLHLVLKYPDDHVENWELATRELLGTAPPGSAEFSQAGAAASLVISPDGRLLVTVHHSSPAKLWRLPELEPLGEIPLPAASAAFMAVNDPEEFSAKVHL